MFPGQPFEQILREYDSDFGFRHTMLQVYLRVCRALDVSDPADPLANKVARAVIVLACEGVRDPEEIYQQALNQLRPAH